MNLHEYQAKALLTHCAIKIPKGHLITTHDVVAKEIDVSMTTLGGAGWVVKAQIHAGGRGKAGGVVKARHPADLVKAVDDLLGKTLVTEQNQPSGQIANAVLVEERMSIARELYLSILVDREHQSLVLIAGIGGMEIESLAKEIPEYIIREYFNGSDYLEPNQVQRIAQKLALPIEVIDQPLRDLHRLFWDKDLSLLEINPLGVTVHNSLYALDCKISIDDNALYRQPELNKLRDLSQEDAIESQAHQFGIHYIALHGNIGCMVNGAGLAMATMDSIRAHDGYPANFLDVGGSASVDTVTKAFRLLLAANVTTILVNIFGGIMRCDIIAEGILTAIADINLLIPVVVRLQGNQADIGRRLLQQSGLSNIFAENDLDEATRLAVNLSQNQAARA